MLSNADNEKWRAATGSLIYDVWVKEMEKLGGQGVMAKKVADRIRELAAPGWK